MTSNNSLDDLRQKALSSYELWDQLTKFFIGLLIVLEFGLGVALIFFTDFSDPVQRLIFLAVATIYAPLGLLVVTLGHRAERNAECILKAIDVLSESLDDTE
jgi:hypothetical protein